MDTKKLEILLASARLGSFTKAAQELGYTQSGLTHMMNALEQEAGFPLLERGHYGTRLTARGQQLEPAIRRFLEAGQALEAEVESIRRQESQWIRVGAYSSMALHWLPAILQQFREEHPNVRVDVQMGGIEELYGWGAHRRGGPGLREPAGRPEGRLYPPEGGYPGGHPAPGRAYEGWSSFPVSEFEGREFLDAGPGLHPGHHAHVQTEPGAPPGSTAPRWTIRSSSPWWPTAWA